MDIYYKTKKLQKMCQNQKEMVKELGQPRALKLMQRLTEIKAANSLDELSKLPPTRCHQLSNNRDNQFAVDLKHPYRLIFEPYHDPVPLNPDGGFKLSEITKVLIIEVVDYHGE